MFSVTHNMSKRKTVPVHQLLGFSYMGLFSSWTTLFSLRRLLLVFVDFFLRGGGAGRVIFLPGGSGYYFLLAWK